MTTQEFSAAFDTLLNSYNSKANFGETVSKTDIVLDEYEKSVFLTQAQDIVIKSYFSSSTNPQGEGIDDSTRRQVDFSGLITVYKIPLGTTPSNANSGATPTSTEGGNTDGDNTGGSNPNNGAGTGNTVDTFDPRGKICSLPSNVLIILNERLEVSTTTGTGADIKTTKKNYVVVPINYTEYDRLMSRAYAQPLKKQCWRLFNGSDSKSHVIKSEIIPIDGAITNNSTANYYIRYIKRPAPIILTNLSFSDQEDLKIGGESSISECELHPIIHMDILNKAFELAIVAKTRALPIDKE